MSSSSPIVAALSAAVSVEHQVVYGYGVAGAQLRGRARAQAIDALTAHRLRRDQLAQLLAARQVTPPVAAVAYALPFPVHDAAAAQQLCVRLEQACTGAAWDLVAASAAASDVRKVGVPWITDAATRLAAWAGAAGVVPALPGQPS